MSQSCFSYNVTRPYPYNWFTPVVVIGSIALMSLFSVINFAATGYEASVSYETNISAIENSATLAWYQRQPWSWASKVSSKCQDQTITVGSQFYTTNYAFPYTVVSINTTTQNQTRSSASFIYHDEHLENCNISSITIRLYTKAEILLTCQILAAPLITTIGLKLNVVIGSELTSTTIVTLPTFLDLSNSTQPSVWWGSYMIEEHSLWILQMATLQNTLKNSDENQTSQLWSTDAFLTISFPVYHTQSSFITRNDSYLPYVDWRLHSNHTDVSFSVELSEWVSRLGAEMLELDSVYWMNYQNDSAKFVTEINLASLAIMGIDGLAKSLYWTILTDLGQSVETNAFTDPRRMLDFWNTTVGLVQNFTVLMDPVSPNRYDTASYILSTTSKVLMMANGSAPTDPTEFFPWYGTGIPQPTTASIATQYLCSVPKLKSRGSLIVGILVADFVFFQVFWHTFNFIVVFYLNRQQPQAQYCSGCSKRLDGTSTDELELGSLHTLPSSTSTERGYERLRNLVGGLASTTIAPANTSGAEHLDSTGDHRALRKSIAMAQPKSVGSDYDEHDMSEH